MRGAMRKLADRLRKWALAGVALAVGAAPGWVKVNGADAGDGAGGGGWSRAGNVLTLSGAGPFELTGEESGGFRVVVAGNAEVTLAGFDLKMSQGATGSSLELAKEANVTLRLKGENWLVAGDAYYAAIRVPQTSALTIADSGEAGRLTVESGVCATGIGGYVYDDMGRVELLGGTVAIRGEGSQDLPSIGGSEVAITGGSLTCGAISPAPVNGEGARVWRVGLTNLVAGAGVEVTRIAGYGGKGIVADGEGKACLWLADGTYEFWAGEIPLRAVVEGADTVATYREVNPKVGVRVDGIDLHEMAGAGWEWNGEVASLTEAREYLIEGTNGACRVRVEAMRGAKLRFAGVELSAEDALTAEARAEAEAFFAGSGNAVGGIGRGITVAGGTVEAGALGAGVAIKGGSVKAGAVEGAVDNGRERVWCVTAGGFEPRAEVAVEGLEGYNTEGIYADGEGKIYLWLPEGDVVFRAGGLSWRANPEGAGVEAVQVETPEVLTGVSVNGVEAAYGNGDGWTFADGVLELADPAETYEVTGTNATGGVRVRICAGVRATFDSVTITNAGGAVEIGAGGAAATLVLRGENRLSGNGVKSAIIVGQGASLEIRGDKGGGSLFAGGGSYAAAIGNELEEICGNIAICGGMVIAEGGRLPGDIGNAFSVEMPTITVTGGSVKAGNGIKPGATDGAGRGVNCVTVGGLKAGELVKLGGLAGYGAEGMAVDGEGKVYLWLADGEWEFRANWRRYRAVVAGAATEAEFLGKAARPFVWTVK